MSLSLLSSWVFCFLAEGGSAASPLMAFEVLHITSTKWKKTMAHWHNTKLSEGTHAPPPPPMAPLKVRKKAELPAFYDARLS